MLDSRRVAVVVPAYDEQAFVRATLVTMPAFVDLVIVVDDASRDATGAEVASAADARVELVRHATNRGVGAAIATGYRRARTLGADVVAVMAGDGQMDPDDLAAVVGPVVRGGADYVKGNRLVHAGACDMPVVRRAGTTVLGWLTSRAAGIDVGDSQCGFTAISSRAIDAIDLDALWPRFGYPNDLLGLLAARGLRVAEVPVRPIYRGEASGLRPWHAVTIGWLVARVAVRRLMPAGATARRSHEERA